VQREKIGRAKNPYSMGIFETLQNLHAHLPPFTRLARGMLSVLRVPATTASVGERAYTLR